MKLYNITLINTGTGQQVYCENLPWKEEPNIDQVYAFITFIRPSLKFDHMSLTYLRDLTENEL